MSGGALSGPGAPAATVACPLAAAARARPTAPALRCGAAVVAYGELDERVRRLTTALRQEGLRAGDRLAVLSGNSGELVQLIHAAARARVALVLLNARLAAPELAGQLARARPAAVLAAAPLRARVPGAPLLEDLVARAARAAPIREPATLDPAAPHSVLFTSGTEGAPKAAVLTAGAHLAAARAANALLALGPDGRVLGTLPLFHVGGLAMVLRCALAGATLELHERFDAAAAVAALADGATHASVVAATLQAVLDAWAAAHGAAPFPATVRAVLAGGGPVPRALVVRAHAARLPVLKTYGLTEAASQVCTERPGEADGATSGVPLVGTAVRVVDADGRPLPPGAAGEIEVQGPTLFAGYLDDAAATRAAFRAGFLRTGDLGTLDDRGRLIVHARRTDLVVSGGENVYPAEVEAALLAHPQVREAAVLGEADARWGAVPVAVVVLRAPRPDGWEGALEAHCRARLAGYKVPRRFIAVDALPHTAAGKVDRRALRARWAPAPVDAD